MNTEPGSPKGLMAASGLFCLRSRARPRSHILLSIMRDRNPMPEHRPMIDCQVDQGAAPHNPSSPHTKPRHCRQCSNRQCYNRESRNHLQSCEWKNRIVTSANNKSITRERKVFRYKFVAKIVRTIPLPCRTKRFQRIPSMTCPWRTPSPPNQALLTLLYAYTISEGMMTLPEASFTRLPILPLLLPLLFIRTLPRQAPSGASYATCLCPGRSQNAAPPSPA